MEYTIGTLEYLLKPADENTRVRLNVMELLFNFASNNVKLFVPILSRLVSLVTKVSFSNDSKDFKFYFRTSFSALVESNAL